MMETINTFWEELPVVMRENSDDGSGKFNRRSVLRTLGAGSIGTLASFSGSAVAKELESVESEELEGTKRDKLLEQARSDEDFQDLINHIDSKGFKLQWDTATTNHVVNKDEEIEYDYLIVEAETRSHSKEREKEFSEEEAILIWTGNSTEKLDIPHHTIGHHVRKRSKDINNETNGFFGWDEITVMVPEGESINEKEKDFHERETGTSKPVVTSSSSCCTVELRIADSATWGCIAQAAMSSIPTSVACTVCVFDPTKISCGACVVALVVYGVSVTHCFNNLGPVVEEEIEESYFEDVDDSCEVLAPGTDEELYVSQDQYNNQLPRC